MIRSATISWRPAAGWVICLGLALTILSLLVAPPPRDLPAYAFPKNLPLGEGRGTLVGAKADIIEADGWHLPDTYRYQYFSPRAGAATDVDILATYYVTPRTDARRLPELYVTRPWQSPTTVQDKSWAQNVAQHARGSDCAWMQIEEEQGIYLVTRIGPDGHSTSTEEQVRQNQNNRRHAHPLQTLSWPFAAHPDVDQRAVWITMTVRKRVDGTPRSPEEVAALWSEVLAAFRAHVPLALHGAQTLSHP